MTAYWLAQGVGVIAFLIGITTFINRDERRFRLQLAVYSAIIGVHFFLMGAGPAGMSAGLNRFARSFPYAPVACGDDSLYPPDVDSRPG